MPRNNLPISESQADERARALVEVVSSIISQRTLPALFEDLTAKLTRFVHFDRLLLLLHETEDNLIRVAGFHSTKPHQAQLGFALP